MARLFRGYQSSGNGKSILPPFEQFEAKFREAFGRELTREERRFYRLIEIVLAESVAENATSVSHGGDILNALDMTGKFFDQLKENVSKWEEAAQALDELLPLIPEPGRPTWSARAEHYKQNAKRIRGVLLQMK